MSINLLLRWFVFGRKKKPPLHWAYDKDKGLEKYIWGIAVPSFQPNIEFRLLYFFRVRSCKPFHPVRLSPKAFKYLGGLLTIICWNDDSSCLCTYLELLRLPSSERFLAEPLLLDNQDFTPSTRSSTSESVSESPWLVSSQRKQGRDEMT